MIWKIAVAMLAATLVVTVVTVWRFVTDVDDALADAFERNR